MSRIAIIGAGAMGSLFGARLAMAGHEVLLIDINAAQIAAINRDGLLLTDDRGDHRIPLRAGLAESFEGPVDLTLLFTKAQHSQAALRDAAHLIGPQSWIVSVQNGLGAGERIAQVLPDAAIAIGMTNWPADLAGPGHVESHGAGEVVIGAYAARDGAGVPAVARLLDEAGLACRTDSAIVAAIWEKVIFNAVMNPVAALTRQTVGGMASHPDGPVLADRIMAEAFAVARAAAIPIDEAHVRERVAFAYREHGPHRPSMLNDIMAGRETEVDVIVGALVDRARQSGVSVPVLETIGQLVRMIALPRNGEAV